MDNFDRRQPHHFHIPVMGTGFSIDTPLRVAKYGISSVVSLSDDVLMEQMRKFHSQRLSLECLEISDRDEDPRANRVTAYLDFLNMIIRDQVAELQSTPFEPGSEITRYYEMLPESPLKQSYSDMLRTVDPQERNRQQEILRKQALPGRIDVNIMTKLDRDVYKNGEKQPLGSSDALSGLRGFALSNLQSSIVFSAGINRRLYSYLAEFKDFFPDDNGHLRKKIVLKVSDFRSAMIQSKHLAKRGLWISEYRIESGLNCGGHAFATEGYLMGPILEEFKKKKAELVDSLHEIYNTALTGLERDQINTPHQVQITVQGGIGTADEQNFLMNYYGVDGTGWGTPFLLVPEVVNVDEQHIERLIAAKGDDVFLSSRSPLGVPFWSLRDTASEEARLKRVNADKPGSPCPKGYLVSNTEFTKVPVCHASRTYQKKKLREIDSKEGSPKQLSRERESVMVKSCICHDLAGSATLKHGIDKAAHPAICCGPNIVSFNKIATLEEMVDHIYGRISLLTDSDRPHMFVRELSLYVDYLKNELQEASDGLLNKTAKRFQDFKENLIEAIDYYQDIAEQFSQEHKERFLQDLDSLFAEIEKAFPEPSASVSPGLIS